jgi:hypothetical protein
MRARLETEPPPGKAAARIGGPGRLGKTGDAELAETEPGGKTRGIDRLAAAGWHFLRPDQRARARAVRLRPGDPLAELLAGRFTITIVDGISLTDRTHCHPRAFGRKHWRSKARRGGLP